MAVLQNNKATGLSVELIGNDCSAKGITKGKTRAILWSFMPDDLSDSTVNLIAIVNAGPVGRLAVRRHTGLKERVRLVALKRNHHGEIVKVGGMFSGLWATTSDSRFPWDTPVPCHTRVE